MPQEEKKDAEHNKPTENRFYLDGSETLVYTPGPLRKDIAPQVSRLLQQNHEDHHCYFNDIGFHNHISHHLFTLYALGADPAVIDQGYNTAASYQRPPVHLPPAASADMRDAAQFAAHMGDENYYLSYLLFFKAEIRARGWRDVVREYLFQGDERANRLLARLMVGVLHPWIYLGFGVEFDQPAMVAEALAQCAIHDGDDVLEWFLKTEAVAERARATVGEAKVRKTTLWEVVEQVHRMDRLKPGNEWAEGRIPEGVIEWAGDELAEITGRYVVRDDEYDLKSAEIMNVAAYFCAACQNPPHIPKLDIFTIHSVTGSIFQPLFGPNCSWLSPAQRTRLLEWKARMDVAVYAARRAPAMNKAEITDYKPKIPGQSWAELCKRGADFPDEGHVCKTIRALAYSAKACGEFEKPVNGEVSEEMWKKATHLAIDCFEAGDPLWMGKTKDGWASVPLRK
ncbi:hypothetical protein B0J12DRAFT_568609 [Macrophomina phaseolina]|uniref:Oxidoreductase AflY n=1 Tax=Macrophomina phaseolina TaxID=35725 RepID=A0ABQ8GI64_9PEZI|nr:hypothetical protein B0J12DRAFT_568609 [Macrophomina phaseolina]